jgi:hypothetical protein
VRTRVTGANVAAPLKTPPIDDVLRSLRAVQRRMFAQRFLATAARGLLLLGAGLLIVGAVKRWGLGQLPWDAQLALWAAVATGALTLLFTLAKRRGLAQTAAAIDQLGETRDRFTTALAFSRKETQPELGRMALEECTAFIRKREWPSLIRLRLPRELAYVVVPAIALALLQWEARLTFGAREADARLGRAEVEGTAQQLEELARETQRLNEQTPTEDLEKLARELKRTAEQLRANATDPEQAAKAQLRELSALEQLVQELQKTPERPSDSELGELAKALKENAATEEAGTSLEAGDLAKAAEQLEQAMQQLAEQKDQRTKEQIDEALQEALKKLADQQQASEAMKKLAEQMQAQNGENSASSEAMEKLAEMLKNMPGQRGQSKQPGSPQNAQNLQNLLAALQNLKFGEGQPSDGKNPQPGDGKQPGQGIVMQSFADANPGGSPDGQIPSGQPGSERDTGTTATPFGKDAGEVGRDGAAQSLTGRLGEGETMQQFLPTSGDSTKSQRRYKELYEAMAPAAQDAVVQENIPLGSRFFIRRYFESIRPRE